MLEPIYITATTLSDAWFQLIYKCVDEGRRFKVDQGSYAGQTRLELDYTTVHIKYPATLPLLPQIPAHYGIPNPVDDNYLDDYLPYLMTGEEKEGESYTYGQRICAAEITGKIKDIFSPDDGDPTQLNQMALLIKRYKEYGHRNNQMKLQVSQPTDMLLVDPPCLSHIDTRIQDGKLHFFPYFRSWDLYGGFPANLAAIEMMKQYMADAIGVENGEIIASSKGLHVYDYVIEIAETLRGKS